MAASITLTSDVLKLAGALDRFNLGDKAMYRYPKVTGDLTVDLTDVTATDTAGLSYLLDLIAFYESKSINVKISYIPEQLIALAQISNVLELLPLSSN